MHLLPLAPLCALPSSHRGPFISPLNRRNCFPPTGIQCVLPSLSPCWAFSSSSAVPTALGAWQELWDSLPGGLVAELSGLSDFGGSGKWNQFSPSVLLIPFPKGSPINGVLAALWEPFIAAAMQMEQSLPTKPRLKPQGQNYLWWIHPNGVWGLCCCCRCEHVAFSSGTIYIKTNAEWKNKPRLWIWLCQHKHTL